MAQNGEATLLLRIKQVGKEVLDRVVFTFGDLMDIAKKIPDAFMAAIDAYGESERALNELTQSMVNQGMYTTHLKNSYLQMADAMEELTGVNDDEIIKSQAVLQAHLGQKEITEELMKATLDLAAYKKMDLVSASEMVGKAISGETNNLKKQGIEFDNASRGAERYGEVIKGIESKAAGFAEKQVAGATSTAKFHNAVDDLLKALGKEFAPTFQQATGWATAFIKAITPEDNFAKLDGMINNVRGKLAELMRGDPKQNEDEIRVKQQYLDRLLAQKKAHLDSERALEAESAEQKRIKEEEERALDLEQKIAQSEEDMVYRQGQYAAELADDDNRRLVLQQNQMKYLDTKIKNEDDGAKKLSLLNQKAALAQQIFETEMDKKKIKDRESTLSTIATLSQSNNSTLAAIGKAAAVTQIAIETPVAISKALSAFPPPANFVAAGVVGVAMAAQAAKIAGVQLAEGGIVMPRPGGTQATIGEAGQAEAVIPLDRANEFGLGGGGVTVNFNGPILGDESQARAFAEKIDVELFKLRKSNSSVAFDSGVV